MSLERGACFAARSFFGPVGALLLFLGMGCSSQDAPPPSAETAAPQEAQAILPNPADEDQLGGTIANTEDAPLPGRDEVPAFLGPRGQLPDRAAFPEGNGGEAAARATGPSAERTPIGKDESAMERERPASAEPTLAELLQQVRFTDDGDEDEEGSFASVISTDRDEDSVASDAGAARWSGSQETARSLEQEPPAPAAGLERKPDACDGIRAAIAKYQAYLERIGAERTAFAYVESAEDATALRLLQAMRRCAEFPEDPDCKAPPMEVELRDVEPPRHTYESWPTDLLGEQQDPDEIAHDPRIRDLLHQLRSCETQQKAQPLLE